MGGDANSIASDSTTIEVRPAKNVSFFEAYYNTVNMKITSGSMGIDLRAYIPEIDSHILTQCKFIPGKTSMIFPTNIRFKFPPRLYGLIKDRSSMAIKGLSVKGGVIDNDYTGEIKVILHNHTDEQIRIDDGDKIAQLVVMKYPQFKLYHNSTKESFDPTERGEQGFGEADFEETLSYNIQRFLENQEYWKILKCDRVKEKLLKTRTGEEYYKLLHEKIKKYPELLELRHPWYPVPKGKNEQGETIYDYEPCFGWMHAIIADSYKRTIEALFKDFDKQNMEENELQLHKEKISVDLDESDDEKETYNLFKKWKEFQNKNKEQKKHEEEEEEEPGPSTRVKSEVKGKTFRAWIEEKMQSEDWIDDPEEYKRQQEAKGLVKRTFRSKDGRYFSRWVKIKKRSQEEAQLDDEQQFEQFLKTIKSKRLGQ